jgi:CBS domain-containing protein
MKVKEAMHKGVEWVGPDTPIIELAKLMRKHDVGAIPIGENDQLIGMVTDRDIVCKGLAEDSDPVRLIARDVMTPGIHCCRDDDDLDKAVRHMEELKVRRLPVINKSKRMIGILSLGDVSGIACRLITPETLGSLNSHGFEDGLPRGRRWALACCRAAATQKWAWWRDLPMLCAAFYNRK